MKNLLLFLTAFALVSCSSTKLNSYNNDFIKQSTQSEFVYLKIDSFPIKVSTSITNDVQRFFGSDFKTEILNQVVKIPEYIGKAIENSKKKYNQNYTARNSIIFSLTEITKNKKNEEIIKLKNLPSFTLVRKIYIKDEIKNAIELQFDPVNLQNGFMVFKFNPKSSEIEYTKAKITKKFPFVNLRIVIKGFYIDEDNGLTQNEVQSKEIVIPFKNGIDFTKILSGVKIYSTPFKIQNLVALEVEVNETNPYFIKLEELETKYNENQDQLSEILRRILIKDEED